MSAASLKHSTTVLAGLCLMGGCSTPSRDAPAPKSPAPLGDPRNQQVQLPAASERWRANLVLDQAPVGVWTVGVRKVFRQFACPEIVGLDDAGRLQALWSYSGKWTPVPAVHDGKWLGGLTQFDLDPSVLGPELYTGSQQGNLYQVSAHSTPNLDSRRIAQFPGLEIHTVVAGHLDLATAEPELLVFTNPGALFVLRCSNDGSFEVVQQCALPGRIRDALVLPTSAEEAPKVATVGRHGRLEVLTFENGQPRWSTVHSEPMGSGRIALAPNSTPSSCVLYSVLDDGRVLRHAQQSNGWVSELIYAGPQGMRGLAAGRFDADPQVESVAVFGYSREVELLTRRGGAWSRETLFVDTDKGHWLCAGELDGRNSTEELVAAGYSGRIVLLSRPPGYGLDGVLARTE